MSFESTGRLRSGDYRSTATIYPEAPTAVAALDDAKTATGRGLVEAVSQRIALFRIGFGLFWAIDAWYKWQPAFRNAFAGMITRPGRTAPALLKPWFRFWQQQITPHAAFFAVCTALLETVLALCLILGIARRPAHLVGALFSLLIWAVPEAFGRFWTSGQTDLGTAIMYAFIFLGLFFLDARGVAGSWSLDRPLAARLPWWRSVAEL